VPVAYKVAFTGIRFCVARQGDCANPRFVARINTCRPETLPHSLWAITRPIISGTGEKVSINSKGSSPNKEEKPLGCVHPICEGCF
jgi:hypothetical protein